MVNFWKVVNKVMEESDVLLLVLDARLVEETKNSEVMDKIKRKEKPFIFVLNKADLVEKSEMDAMKKHLKPLVFVSSLKFYGTTLLRNKILEVAKRHGHKEGDVIVGVLGYPNVGKSSLINALKGKSSAPTSSVSGYTKNIQRVRADNKIVLLDTPGVIPYKEKDEVKHAVISSVDYSKVKDPDLAVFEIMLQYPEKIEEFYDVRLNDAEKALEEIALKNNILKKKGLPDTQRMARLILKNWQEGKIK